MSYSFDIKQLPHYQLEDYCKLSNVIEFDQCLEFLKKTGRISFGNHFDIDPLDYKVIFQLLVYFYHDYTNAERLGIDLRKGILLSGPVGCGKTSLMFLMRFLLCKDEQFVLRDCRNVSMEFVKDGFQVIEKYSIYSFLNTSEGLRPKTYCFDDLGSESSIVHFGNEAQVMAEILMCRYPLFTHQKMCTHATTNLSAPELEKRYGKRVRSRMREMFNLIAFDDCAADKRI